MTDRPGQPWNGVYNGFSAAPPIQRRHPIPKAATVGVGVGCALVMGLLVGVFAKPDLSGREARRPMRAVTPAAIMPVVVSAPIVAPAAPTANPVGKLEVLPADMARAANSAPTHMPLPVSTAPMSQPLPVAAPPQLAAVDPACAGARGRAAQLICSDPDIAAADRELNRAYRRALRNGAFPERIQADQRDWLAAREDTARRAPLAVADLYAQRIEELDELADDGPG